MFKGFLALFTTGIIFKPMLLLGVIVGVGAYIGLDGERLKVLYTDWHLYTLFFLIAALYTYFFRKTYLENSYAVDWKETVKTMISEFFVLSFCFVVGMLLASFFDFSLPESSTKSITYSENAEISDMKKQAEDMMQNYNALLDSIK